MIFGYQKITLVNELYNYIQAARRKDIRMSNKAQWEKDKHAF